MKQIKIKQLSGFTLLETMVSLIILGFGLLGVAALQINSQQSNRSAYFETQAVIVAHDMLERIRANPAGNEHYHLPKALKHDACYSALGCPPLEMAQNDMYEWADPEVNSIANKLPSGAGIVCLDTTPDDGTPSSPSCDGGGNSFAIKVWWEGSSTRRAIITAAFK